MVAGGGVGPVDRLEVCDLREQDGPDGDARDGQQRPAVVQHALQPVWRRCVAHAQKQPARRELPHARKPQRLHPVAAHEHLRQRAVDAPERGAQKRKRDAAAKAGALLARARPRGSHPAKRPARDRTSAVLPYVLIHLPRGDHAVPRHNSPAAKTNAICTRLDGAAHTPRASRAAFSTIAPTQASGELKRGRVTSLDI
jgi:hypothetical protein